MHKSEDRHTALRERRETSVGVWIASEGGKTHRKGGE